MACGGNARGGLWVGMRRGGAPRRPHCGGPSVAATRRDCQGSLHRARALQLQTHYAWFGVHMSEYFSARWPTPTWSSGAARSRRMCARAREPKCRISTFRSADRKRKIRNEIECDTENSDLGERHVAAALFTFWRRWWWSRAQPANAGWQLSEAGPPGLSVDWPSCHLSNDFFILQEELVARGNALLPAWGNPTLGQADAGTRYVCSHIARDQHTLSSCLCFFAFFLPLSTQSSVSPFLLELPFVLGGFNFTSQ